MNSYSNLSVLGVASLARTLPVVGAALTALFVVMRPEATAGLGFLGRLGFWSAHIGVGLLGILLASTLLGRLVSRQTPLPLALVVTGVAGAALLAPAYTLIERFATSLPAEVPDDWLDRLALEGPLQNVLAEFIEVLPMYLSAWIVINLPLLLAKPSVDRPSQPGDPDGPPAVPTREAVSLPAQDAAPASADGAISPMDRFLDTLPDAVGRDVVAVSSDLHYLHVHTTLGRCMVPGALRRAAEALEDDGMLVHRSHWVAHKHVRRIIKQGSAWVCLMSNDLRIPVSRRNKAPVAKWFGSGNVVVLPKKRDAASR